MECHRGFGRCSPGRDAGKLPVGLKVSPYGPSLNGVFSQRLFSWHYTWVIGVITPIHAVITYLQLVGAHLVLYVACSNRFCCAKAMDFNPN